MRSKLHQTIGMLAFSAVMAMMSAGIIKHQQTGEAVYMNMVTLSSVLLFGVVVVDIAYEKVWSSDDGTDNHKTNSLEDKRGFLAVLGVTGIAFLGTIVLVYEALLSLSLSFTVLAFIAGSLHFIGVPLFSKPVEIYIERAATTDSDN